MRSGRTLHPVLGERCLDFIPQGLFDNGLMFTGIGVSLVRDLAASRFDSGA